MAILAKKRIVIALVLLMSCLFASPAYGQDLDDKNAYEAAYEECLENHDFTKGWLNRAVSGVPENVSKPVKQAFCMDKASSEHPGAAAATAAGAAASKFWGDPIGDFVKALMEGNTQTLQMVMTFWFDFSTVQTRSIDASIQGVKNIVAGLAGLALIASFVIGGYRIAASRRMGLQDGVEETAGVVVKYIVFSFGVVAAVPGALIATDILANEIMDSFGVQDPGQVVDMASLDESMAGPVIIMLLAIVSLLGGIMQIIALVVRTLVLPIVVGLTPLAAAASFSETGRGMLSSLMSYMIAAVVYKPIAALLYAVVMWNAATPSEGDVIAAAVNVLMIALAGFCAPALVRIIAPMTQSVGGGGAAPLVSAAGAGVSGALGATAMMASGGAAMLAGSAAKAAPAAAGGGASQSVVGGAPVASTSRGAGSGGTSASASVPAGSSGASAGGSSASVPAGASGATGGGAVSAGARGGGGRPTQQPRSSGMAGALGVSRQAATGAGRGVGRGISVAERVGAAGLSGAGQGLRGAASVARSSTAGASHAQRVLDDSVGVGGYQGVRH
ncbi:hypothetical protein [Corynebacterium sp. 11A]|nr:hypothetical protein [Corynebacterium sp. 11A]